MFRYKNCSGSTYRFYDVVFQPWDVHEVPGSISHPKFIRTDEPVTDKRDEKPQNIESTNSVTATETQLTPQSLNIPEQEENRRGRRSKGE